MLHIWKSIMHLTIPYCHVGIHVQAHPYINKPHDFLRGSVTFCCALKHSESPGESLFIVNATPVWRHTNTRKICHWWPPLSVEIKSGWQSICWNAILFLALFLNKNQDGKRLALQTSWICWGILALRLLLNRSCSASPQERALFVPLKRLWQL